MGTWDIGPFENDTAANCAYTLDETNQDKREGLLRATLSRTIHARDDLETTVKLRTKVTRRAGSPAAALAMVLKLVESAQARWRAIRGAHLVALVPTGATFENGVLVEREEAAA